MKIQPLGRHQTELILEELRKRIAKVAGVTLVTDDNGAHGPMGATYLTVRWGNPMVEVQMQVLSVSDTEVDRRAEWEAENPQ